MLTAKKDRKDKLRAISTHQDVNLLHFCSLLHKLQWHVVKNAIIQPEKMVSRGNLSQICWVMNQTNEYL